MCDAGLTYYCDLEVINQTTVDTRPHNTSHPQLRFRFRKVKVIISTVTQRSQQHTAARALCGNTRDIFASLPEKPLNNCALY